MTTAQIIGLILAVALMGVGLLGTVVPGVPGAPLVLVVAVAHRLCFGPASLSNSFLVVLLLLTLLSIGLDYVATMVGAKKLGATWRGVVGAILGALVGLFFGLPGILLGPFIGALALVLIGGREFRDAVRAGGGALLGLVLGAAGRVGCCLVMIALFVVNVIVRSGTTLPV
jgi:uncharacterized protein YqgC (DUF456 family)